MAAKKLKPCPFCGTKNPYNGIMDSGWGSSYVRCRNSDCQAGIEGAAPCGHPDPKEEAEAKWNRRAK